MRGLMQFEVALLHLKMGRRIRRSNGLWIPEITNGPDGFSYGDHIFARGGTIMKHEVAPSHDRVWVPTSVDVMAEDWEIAPEPRML